MLIAPYFPGAVGGVPVRLPLTLTQTLALALWRRSLDACVFSTRNLSIYLCYYYVGRKFLRSPRAAPVPPKKRQHGRVSGLGQHFV